MNPGGCGNSEFCKTCGALNAILSSQEGNFDLQECCITRKATGDALDLRVWATPNSITGERFTISLPYLTRIITGDGPAFL